MVESRASIMVWIGLKRIAVKVVLNPVKKAVNVEVSL